jgi:uncharacterized membrane protein YdjX (TVP38/TMEM64 family)
LVTHKDDHQVKNLKFNIQGQVLWRIAAVVAVMGTILGSAAFVLNQVSPTFLSVFTNHETLIAYIDGFGHSGPLVYVLLQAAQVVIAPIPGELTGSIAGVLFGGTLGFVYASCGLALGSLIAFSIGRVFGQPIINWMVPEKQRRQFGAISSRKQLLLVFIVFVIPGFPKDSLTYLFSVGNVGYWSFFIVSQVARMPGTFLLAVAGNALISGNWTVLATMIIIAAGAAWAAYSRRSQILTWLRG